MVKPIPRLKTDGDSFTVDLQLARSFSALEMSRISLPDLINVIFDDISVNQKFLRILGTIRSKDVFVGNKNGIRIFFIDSDLVFKYK